MSHIRLFSIALMAAASSGCGGSDRAIDALDNEISASNAGDVEEDGALQNQIVVDPAKTASNMPGTIGALAAQQGNPRTARCATRVKYGADWTAKLPADMPLYAGAKVSEAAGTDEAGCAMRVVSFASVDPVDKLAEFYLGRGKAAGYEAEHQVVGSENRVGGTRDADGSAYVVFINARADGGSDADLVVNRDR